MMVKNDKPTVVGALACQRNSFLFKGFKTEVLSCTETTSKDKPKYEVELKDTILFPEGGGQPSDSGYFKIINDEVEVAEPVLIPVLSVIRKGLHAIHHINEKIESGTKIEVIVDEEKRMDHMQQHSGQHLLSAILELPQFNVKTVAWSMGGISSTKKKSVLEPSDYFSYIEMDRKLTLEEVANVSRIVNEYINMKPLPIKVIERTPDMYGDIDSSKVPEDYNLEKGILRTIHIGDIDANPCCGTHLTSTAQIENILILPNQTNIRGSNSRLYFMCGRRVRNYAQETNKIINSIKALLSCNESQIDEKIIRLQNQVHQANKREQFWIKELALFESEKIFTQLQSQGKAYLLKDEYGSLEFLLQVFKALSVKLNTYKESYHIVLCGREKVQSGQHTGSLLILSDSGEVITNTVREISPLLANLRGGGGKNGGKWQGKIIQFNDTEWNALSSYLQNI